MQTLMKVAATAALAVGGTFGVQQGMFQSSQNPAVQTETSALQDIDTEGPAVEAVSVGVEASGEASSDSTVRGRAFGAAADIADGSNDPSPVAADANATITTHASIDSSLPLTPAENSTQLSAELRTDAGESSGASIEVGGVFALKEPVAILPRRRMQIF